VVSRWLASLIPDMGDVSPELAKPVLAAAFLQFCGLAAIWFVFSRSGSSAGRAPEPRRGVQRPAAGCHFPDRHIADMSLDHAIEFARPGPTSVS